MKQTEKNILVRDRLRLVDHLNMAEHYFKGRLYGRDLPNNEVIYPLYENYFGLKIYLLLTCFDILGQRGEWLDFNSWLLCKKKEKKKEKDEIFQKNHFNGNPETYIASIHKEYSNIYGVKNSFYYFVQNVISQENRFKLFNSISTTEIVSEYKINNDGTHSPPCGKQIALDEDLKLKFLFQLRNSFTHKGIAYGTSIGAVFDINRSHEVVNGEPYHYMYGIHKEQINGKTIVWEVRQWPFILSEILNETIDYPSVAVVST